MSHAKAHPNVPTHVLAVKQVGQEKFSEIGVGWERCSGGISVKLDTCTTISWNDDVTLYLFPVGHYKKRKSDAD